MNEIRNKDCLEGLRQLADQSVNCCVTSPPYYGLRDYGVDGQFGLEKTPEEYVAKMVEVFREVRRVLKDDGTLWLNLGDSYVRNPQKETNPEKNGGLHSKNGSIASASKARNARPVPGGMKAKDLIGIPWMVAFALRADGWYLRQDIIWAKPNPMPESTLDRCTKAHEYIFLMSKSSRYYYDNDAVREMATSSWNPDNAKSPDGWDTGEGSHGSFHKNGREKGKSGNKARKSATDRGCPSNGVAGSVPWEGLTRNRRSVWTVASQAFPEAHFATFPEEIPAICIKAGCPIDGLVLDPFSGAGTTALVARKLNRNYIGFEINAEYVALSEKRLEKELGMFK